VRCRRRGRNVGDPVDELVDEIQKAVIGPVDVFEHQHGGALLGHALDESPPSREGFIATVSAELRLLRESDERQQVRLDPRGIGFRQRVRGGTAELVRHLGRSVLLVHARLRLDDLTQRPERDAVAVCEAAALPPRDELGVGVDDPRELVDEPTLPDAGDPDERDELRRTRMPRAFECVSHDAELAFPTDELRARVVGDVDPKT
jgi:hypothetical protein